MLTYATGKLYLAGPYKGAPLSVAAIVPAVAGPFDVGTVVTREALRIDPRTAEVEADGSSSDPIPHILAGIPLKVRDVRVYVDKPDFTLNPTSCEEMATGRRLGRGAMRSSAPSTTQPTPEARFQAADCASLGFKPRLKLLLRGGTRRGAFPALHLVYAPAGGDANLQRLALRFPRSEFIEQGHFRTICTRVQFAAGQGFGSSCPKGSVYGHVKVWTSILDQPLTGKVFLRSSNHNLPDVVLALEGPPSLPVQFEAATRIDSVHGGLRAIAAGLPDVPLTRVGRHAGRPEGTLRQLHQPLRLQASRQRAPRRPQRPDRQDQAAGAPGEVRATTSATRATTGEAGRTAARSEVDANSTSVHRGYAVAAGGLRLPGAQVSSLHG